MCVGIPMCGDMHSSVCACLCRHWCPILVFEAECVTGYGVSDWVRWDDNETQDSASLHLLSFGIMGKCYSMCFLFLKHGHWLHNSVLPTYEASTTLRGHCPRVINILICLSSFSLAQTKQRLFCFHFTDERLEVPVRLTDIPNNRKGPWDYNENSRGLSVTLE